MRAPTVFHGSPKRWAPVLLWLALASNAQAGEPPTIGPLDIGQAVEYALRHHPVVRAQSGTEEARHDEVLVARTGYLPELDVSAQLNAGTGNVLRGSIFPMPGIPSVTGPPTGRSLGDAALGSVAGAAIAWDATSLIEDMALVDAALAEEAREHATTEVVRLDVSFEAAIRFIDVLAHHRAVRAAAVASERTKVFATSVKALADQGLRPGADYARASAEVALASTDLLRAEAEEAVSRVALARALGTAGSSVALDEGRLLEPPGSMPPSVASTPPEVIAAQAGVRAGEARDQAVRLQFLPRLELVSALWVRGSGLTSGGLAASPGGGAIPDTPNWAAGLVIVWPVLDLARIHARSQADAARLSSARAHQADVLDAVRTQIESARVLLEASRRIAGNTPVAVAAAREAEQQATARYRAGLASVDTVAEADRLLARAELDDSVARLNLRRAELVLARATGDLSPFFEQLREGR